MNILDVVKEYVDATKSYELRIDNLNKALADLETDNYLIGTIPADYSKNRDNLLKLIIGENNFDWVMWFLYEKGNEDASVWIDGVKYLICDIEDLNEICFDKTDLDFSN